MYEDFINDIAKSKDEEEIGSSGLSEIVFNMWMTQKVKLEDGEDVLADSLEEAIKELSNEDFKEDQDLLDSLYSMGYTKREDNRLGKVGFENRIEQHYGLELYYMELVDILSRELGDLFYKCFTRESSMNSIEELLLYQHIRCCSIYTEVIHLIRGGFGTGALTRFRSIHELAVITEFISNNGNVAAEYYFDYLPVMQRKDIKFEEKVFGDSVVDEEYDKELQETLRKIEERRGKDFVNYKELNDYVWAEDFLPNDVKPSFNQIRKSIKRNHGLKPYKIASNNIHSAPRSLTSSLGTPSGEVNGGASNIGLSLPGTWATYEMNQLNRLLFAYGLKVDSIKLYEQLQAMFIVKMINHLVSKLNINFPNKENALLTDDTEEG